MIFTCKICLAGVGVLSIPTPEVQGMLADVVEERASPVLRLDATSVCGLAQNFQNGTCCASQTFKVLTKIFIMDYKR